jgi:hypothetical protein
MEIEKDGMRGGRKGKGKGRRKRRKGEGGREKRATVKRII